MAIEVSASAASLEVSSDYTRLHITPFNPALLAAIIPPSILPTARNISYHTLQTFPEKGFGFVELPVMDAEKIKKKLHGSILKGTKVRIEEARPMKEQRNEDDEPAKPKKEKPEKSKKRKREEVIPGAELRDRKVKRGWTDPTAPRRSEKKSRDKKDKKDVVKSKYTSGPECLFRTTVPANVAAASKDIVAAPLKDKKRKSKAGKETVVHEFAKTTKYATFLRQTNGPAKTKGVAEFVEGKGWIDEEGNLVEAAVISKKPLVTKPIEKAKMPSQPPGDDNVMEESDSEGQSVLTEADLTTSTPISNKKSKMEDGNDSTSSSGTSSEGEESNTNTPRKIEADEENDSNSSSDTSSKEEDSELESDAESTAPSTKVSTPRPMSSSGAPLGLTIHIPPPPGISTTTTTEVHPLEALFKRPKPPAISATETPVATTSSFSFFGADDNEEEEELAIPMTPFTQQDFAYRGLRSAAPTPDTAHPSRNFWSNADDDADEEDSENEAGFPSSPSLEKKAAKGKGKEEAKEGEGAPITDFQKWFYENRGDTNRAWKKRRKLASKEQRQRENRKRGEQRL